MRSKFQFLFLFCLLCTSALAQETIVNCTDSTFCVPSVIGLPRSKGIVIKREIVRDYSIQSESDELGNSSAELRRNRRWEFKVRAPIIMKDGFKMAAGLKYFVEEHNFENPESLNYPFYQNLENRSLRSIRGELFLVKPTKTNKFYLLRISGGLNGDYGSDLAKHEFFKFSISPLIGWKKNDYVSYAFGLAFSYGLGNRSILPIIAYNKSFNNQWGMEMVLPAEAKLRYSTLNQKNFLYLKAELNGSNYSVRLDESQDDLLYLNKSEVRFLLSWEREIHDWLWFGIETGMRSNINFDLSSETGFNANTVVDNKLNAAMVYNMSIFVVPPRKLLK